MSSMFYELYPNKTFFFPLKNGFTELKTYSSQKIRGRLPYREEKKGFLGIAISGTEIFIFSEKDYLYCISVNCGQNYRTINLSPRTILSVKKAISVKKQKKKEQKV